MGSQSSPSEVLPAIQQVTNHALPATIQPMSNTTQNTSKLPKLSLSHLMVTPFIGQYFWTRLMLPYIQIEKLSSKFQLK